MENKRITEIITCYCGTTFAACSDGHQDDEWRRNRSDYLQAGCKVDFVESKDVTVWGCDCPKTPKEIAERNQLQLFE